MPFPNDIPLPIATPIGIHGSIRLGTSAGSLASFEVSSGSITSTANMVKKPSTARGIVRSEPGLAEFQFECAINVDATSPPSFRVRDRIYFQYKVNGRVTATGNFLLAENPDSFQADGDAPYSLKGPIQDITFASGPAA